MKGLIMAGGEGTRLRPLTCGKPKPMLEIMGLPVMEHIIGNLKAVGITEIAVTLMYLPRSIQDYFGDGSRFGVSLRYFTESAPLGTAGSVKNAREFLDDEFIIISGDCLTDTDLAPAIDFHRARRALATLVLAKVAQPEEYGLVITDDEGKITRFVEKPSPVEVLSDAANTGIYIVNPTLLELIPSNQQCDFSRDVFPGLLAKKMPLYGYVSNGYWCDIGDLAAYRQCHFDILDGKLAFPLHARQNTQGIWIEEGAVIADDAVLAAPCYIGRDCVLRSGARVLPYTVLGQNCKLAAGASVKHSLLHKNVTVGQNAQLRGCIAGDGVHVGSGSTVLEHAVVGEQTYVGDQCEIRENIKIWPHKNISNETTVSDNLVWGSNCSKKLFGERGISGELNVDITPEFAARLGAAYGAMLQGGAVAVGCEYESGFTMLKHAVLAGLMSTGAATADLGAVSLPAMRRAVKFYGQDGGIHIDGVVKNGELRPAITFLGATGADMGRQQERVLETLFMRQDFVRCEPDQVKPTVEYRDYQSYYLNEMVQEFWGQPLTTPIHLRGSCGTARAVLHKLGAHTPSVSKGCVSLFMGDSSQHLAITDEEGRLVSDDLYFAIVCHILLLEGAKTVVAPLIASSCIDELAQAHKASVLRCKTGRSDQMEAMLQNGAVTQFRMLFDGCYAAVKLCAFLSSQGISLHRLVDEMPNIHIVQREISCDYAKIGAVMQSLAKQNKQSAPAAEGVRIATDKGWIVLMPHPSKPKLRMVSESVTQEFAAELCNFYEQEIKRRLK